MLKPKTLAAANKRLEIVSGLLKIFDNPKVTKGKPQSKAIQTLLNLREETTIIRDNKCD